jgi:hypothetical protein
MRSIARRSRARATAIACGVAVLAGVVPPADARADKTLAYRRDQAWPAAVRFLVVDERARITDKDAEAGYVIFELREDKKTFRGSLELATVDKDGRTAVRFVLQIEDRPSWAETSMLARLERKLRAELGAPTPPPTPPPAPARPAEPPRPEPPRADDHDDHAPPVSPTP